MKYLLTKDELEALESRPVHEDVMVRDRLIEHLAELVLPTVERRCSKAEGEGRDQYRCDGCPLSRVETPSEIFDGVSVDIRMSLSRLVCSKKQHYSK